MLPQMSKDWIRIAAYIGHRKPSQLQTSGPCDHLAKWQYICYEYSKSHRTSEPKGWLGSLPTLEVIWIFLSFSQILRMRKILIKSLQCIIELKISRSNYLLWQENNILMQRWDSNQVELNMNISFDSLIHTLISPQRSIKRSKSIKWVQQSDWDWLIILIENVE